MTAVTTQKSYSSDWRRTNPDLVVFLPPAPPYYPEAADHILGREPLPPANDVPWIHPDWEQQQR